ncbi:hypothetical protein GCM10023214_57960 [Amycolatopsis dongchuanensis]|uniref:Uncharacterized protein n=1 Tax=Amycolatopsis dongchuanensis TaxID=1070866 RepID=A0ABP8VD44_9PSEU
MEPEEPEQTAAAAHGGSAGDQEVGECDDRLQVPGAYGTTERLDQLGLEGIDCLLGQRFGLPGHLLSVARVTRFCR